MNTITLLKHLERKPTFTIQDIQRITSKDKPYSKEIIHRLKKEGYIKKITKNTYTTKDNIYVIASNITYPSYISFWSASRFRGYTDQILNTVQIATTAKKKKIEFEKNTIKFIPIKHFFGYEKITTTEGDIFIAEDEKLIIDALTRPDQMGNESEIENIFKKAIIDKKKITEYLKRTGSQTIIKRVGYLLEKTRGIDIRDSITLDRNYINLYAGKKQTHTDTKWRVRT